MPKLPNFFIVGTPKAGTTALYHQLREHPDIFMPSVKEPSFFSERPKKDGTPMTQNHYRSLFKEAASELAVGEASPDYFHSKRAPRNIAEFNPEARIIAMLRQPVERSHSHFLMMQNSGVSPFSDFAEASEKTIENLKKGKSPPYGSGYRQSFYSEALLRYYSRFPQQNVLLLRFSHYKQNPLRTHKRIYSFLGVDSSFTPKNLRKKYNGSYGMPKSRTIHNLIFRRNIFKTIAKALLPAEARRFASRSLMRINKQKKEKLDNKLAAKYTSIFLEDIQRLEAVTGMDFSEWHKL